jgi:cytidine deaminase
MTEDEWERLRARAIDVREQAYAPYSRFLVGAALMDERERIYAGANVENAAYPLGLCAERSAVAAAIADGARRFKGLLLVVDASEVATPCGGCRQVLREFPPSFPVRCITLRGDFLNTTVEALLPHAFGPDLLP